LGLNPFENESKVAKLTRHMKNAYEAYIKPAFRVMKQKKKERDNKKAAIDSMRKIFSNNLLHRLSSSPIPEAVDQHYLRKQDQTPNGVVGQDNPSSISTRL
jgi:hypothetical protein